MSKNARITVSISPEVKDQLDQYADQNGLDRSAAFEKIVVDYFGGGRQRANAPAHPAAPAPTPAAPVPVPEARIPGNLLREIEGLKTSLKRIEKEHREARNWLTQAYPPLDTMSNLLLQHHVYQFGQHFQGAIVPAPPWWDPNKAPLVPFQSLPEPKDGAKPMEEANSKE